MLIATAGHIDHGKSALIRALTGIETDRLPEEQARGISIDLGFAYWRPEPGLTIGFVDVPGHERYLRNMLAGLPGIRFALLVVAADDGVMPQTVEHLQLLDLLGVRDGIVALNKCDRAGTARLDEVRREIRTLVAGTGLAGIPTLEVSAVTGAGVPPLAAALVAAARSEVRQHDPLRGPRLAIDRAFTIAGSGTVVTGTLLGGAIAIGDRLFLDPRGSQARVRGLQSAGRAVERGEQGQRCAVNLAGIEVADVRRGDWLVDAAQHAPSARLQVRVEVLPSRAAALRHNAALRLHHGAAEIAARVLTTRQRRIDPGERDFAVLVLEEPTSALTGERFVLRDPACQEIVGGGLVLDPHVPERPWRQADRTAVLEALALGDPATSLRALLAIRDHELSTPWFARCFGIAPQAVRALLEESGASVLGREGEIALPARRRDEHAAAAVAALGEIHQRQPDVEAVPVAALRKAVAAPPSVRAFEGLLRQLAEAGEIELRGSRVKLPGHVLAFSPTELALWSALRDWLDEIGPRPARMDEIARELRTPEPAVRALLYRRRTNGDLWALDDGRFLLSEHVARLAATAGHLAQLHPGGFTAAQYRDASGIGRNSVIRLLEFLDRIGVTARRGERRIVRRDYTGITGAAEPYLAGAFG